MVADARTHKSMARVYAKGTIKVKLNRREFDGEPQGIESKRVEGTKGNTPCEE